MLEHGFTGDMLMSPVKPKLKRTLCFHMLLFLHQSSACPLVQAVLCTPFEFQVESNEDALFYKSTQARESIGALYESVYYTTVGHWFEWTATCISSADFDVRECSTYMNLLWTCQGPACLSDCCVSCNTSQNDCTAGGGGVQCQGVCQLLVVFRTYVQAFDVFQNIRNSWTVYRLLHSNDN